MKKQFIMWQKQGEFLKPAHFKEWNEFQESVPDGGWLQSVFTKPTKPKTHEQLKYLYGIVYPHLLAWYDDTQGFLYERKIGNEIIEVKCTKDRADEFFKFLFCINQGIEKFKKENSDIEQMINYINFLDKLSIDNFGCELPPPTKNNNKGVE